MLKICLWGNKKTLKSWNIFSEKCFCAYKVICCFKVFYLFLFYSLLILFITPKKSQIIFSFLQNDTKSELLISICLICVIIICDWRNFAYNCPGLSYMIFYNSFHNRYEPTISVGCLVASDQGSLCFWCDFVAFATW